MNNKGFMMAEVVVVSAVVLVTLVALYVSHNKILTIYNQRVDYYDTKTLYELAEIRYSQKIKNYQSTDIIVDEENKKVYLVRRDHLEYLEVENQTFKDYIDFLSTATEFETEYILLMERCTDKDNCKYAYLEVYNR